MDETIPQTQNIDLQLGAPAIVTWPAVPENVKFINSLLVDIKEIEYCVEDVKRLTVKNATRCMIHSVIKEDIDVMKRICNNLVSWRDNPSTSSDMSELSVLIDEIQRDSNDYLDEKATDVRCILDVKMLRANVLQLNSLYLFTELYIGSSLFTMLRQACIMLLNTIRGIVTAAIHDLDLNHAIVCDESLRIMFFERHPDMCSMTVDRDTVQPLTLMFTEHDQQIIFSPEEMTAIHLKEVEAERAAHEREVLQQKVSFAKCRVEVIAKIVGEEECLKRELSDLIALCSLNSVADCEKINCLWDTLRWIASGTKDEAEAVKNGLLTIADIMDGKDANVYRQLGKIDPLEIASAMTFFPEISASSLTSKEEIVVRNEPYAYTEDTVILLNAK